jgi:N-acetylated-alpha-linked acidic dipeptidase
VIATIKGKEYPDQWVIRGNHHDGWVFGAHDPLSGNVVMMEEAKAIGQLVKSGWKPKRTIIYASWDAEEPGLIGSTEWAEQHATELQKKAVAYVNSDSNERGFFEAEGSHSLQTLVNQVAADTPDPQKGVSIADRLRAKVAVEAASPMARDDVKQMAAATANGGEFPLAPLGSGSDYTGFLQHLGVASLNIGFGGEGQMGGIYHSIYDSYDHFNRYGDPKYEYEVALAKAAGRIMLRLADGDAPPMRFEPVSAAVDQYLKEVKALVEKAKAGDEKLAKLLESKAYALSEDPTKPVAALVPETPVQALDFSPLDTSAKRLDAATKAFDAAYAAKVGQLSKAQQASLEATLAGMEQGLTSAEGLPGRPWFHHMLYAPGVLTGYGAKTLPGVREAIESRRWAEAQTYIGVTAKTLDTYAERLERGATALNGK